jgi:hypothetical protein
VRHLQELPDDRCEPASRTIDCDDCVMRATSACHDCVVSFVVGREPGTALVIDAAEVRAVRMLADAGLVPELRHAVFAGAAAAARPCAWSPTPRGYER